LWEWTKGLELAKIARRNRQHFGCATWLDYTRASCQWSSGRSKTAGLLLGTDKSHGYCLEMENPDVFLQSALRFFKFLPGEERQTFLHHVNQKAS
jgi:hypothetical protein